MEPTISVIIPTYNYAQFIADSVNSVLNQPYPKQRIEIVIVDDGSTDNTREVIENFQTSAIKYLYQPNRGKANATKKAIELATGTYIFNLDADDYFLPGKIEKTIEIFVRYPEVVHVASPALCVLEAVGSKYIEPLPTFLYNKSNNGAEVLAYFYANRILFGGGSTFAARADILKDIEIPDDVDMYIDEYLILATLGQGHTFFIDEPLSAWRVHGNNYSGHTIGEKLGVKIERLQRSSKGMLKAIQGLPLPERVKKIYELQHWVRALSFKEACLDKSVKDVVDFLFFILSRTYNMRILKRYSAFNRLLPTRLLFALKKAQLLIESCDKF